MRQARMYQLADGCLRSLRASRNLSASMKQPHRLTEMAVAVNTPL